MTQEQVEKAKKLSENIYTLTVCINDLTKGRLYGNPYNDFEFKECCHIAKDEVLPIFEKKLQELKNELAEL